MEEKENQIVLGTLYDMNKALVKQTEKKLSESVLNSKKEIIKNFIDKSNNYYFMLLCNERKDYTVFEFLDCTKWPERCMDCAKCLIDECLIPRGEIRGIDLTKNKDAIEIWMLINDEIYVYYFFPCDNCIVTDF